MDFPSTFNARRLVYLCGKPFWVRAFAAQAWADLLAWLDDVIPGRADRELPPELGGPEAQGWLESDDGRAIVLWLALRDDEDMAYETAAEMSRDLRPGEYNRLIGILTARRRTARPGLEGASRDLAETWCGEGLAELGTAIGLEAMGRLSLDQIEWLQSGGKCDEHADPDVKARLAAQRAWQEAEEARKAEAERVAAETGQDVEAVKAASVTVTAEEADRRRIAMIAALKEQAARRDAGQDWHVPTPEDVERILAAGQVGSASDPRDYKLVNLDTGEEIV